MLTIYIMYSITYYTICELTYYTIFGFRSCTYCTICARGDTKKMAFDQIKYQNQYNKENYARLSVQVPKADRDMIDEHWKSKGYKSFNAYVNELIRKDMNENGNGGISVGNIEQTGEGNSISIG